LEVTGGVRDAAVVVATNHDHPTQFMYNVAEQVRDLLDSYFEVVSFIPYAPPAELFVELFALKSGQPEGPRGGVVFGYFSAHGACDGLRGPGGLPVFEQESARLLRQSILIFTACLGDGTFPSRLVDHPDSVRAIIGYRRQFQVPNENACRHLSEDEFERLRSHMTEPVLATVRTLLVPGRTIIDARNETLVAWRKMANDTSCPMEIRSLAWTNISRLTVWPDGSNAVLIPKER
jgi:hypothetical protein